MIQWAHKEDSEALRLLCGGALGARIYATFLAYGTDVPGISFWVSPHAAYGLTDGILTVAGCPKEEDREEARMFVEFLSPARVVCSPDAAHALGLTVREQGPTMMLDAQGDAAPCGGIVRMEELRLRQVCAFLQACRTEHFRMPEGTEAADAFFLDFSHRVRHGAADGMVYEHEGAIAATALAVVTPTDALITAVAVAGPLRRRGFGRKTVEALCRRLPGRRCHLLRAETENRAFYEALGFTESGRWAECTL